MTKPRKTPQQLADEHWDWLESILYTDRAMQRKLFKDAFLHGYKHGRKDNKIKNE